jgi:hypothetical protein
MEDVRELSFRDVENARLILPVLYRILELLDDRRFGGRAAAGLAP